MCHKKPKNVVVLIFHGQGIICLPCFFIPNIFLVIKIFFPWKSVTQPLQHNITQDLQVTTSRGNYKNQNTLI